MSAPKKVLVVDDSAFIRKVFRQILSRSPDIEVVGTAADGDEALDLVERLKPDVVTLDLNMPDVDGVEFVRRQMARRPIPIVICSVAHASGAATLAALEAGAVDFLQKPTALATDVVFDLADELISKVMAAAGVDVERLRPARAAPPVAVAPRRSALELIAIGLSTGGPQALRSVIPRLPSDFPVPIAIVLHMPVGYTELYAARLDEISELTVVEAKEGAAVVAGTVVIAAAGRHLRVARGPGKELVARLSLEPAGVPHRPSVDALFESAAEVCGAATLGVVLTGMGSDGLEGARRIKERGGRIVSESMATCVVYGMPRSIEESGLSDYVTGLPDLPALLAQLV